VLIVKGGDEPGAARSIHRIVGDVTVLADGRLALMTMGEEVHDLGEVLAALVGEPRDALGDRHVGRVRLTVEVVDRHERLNNEGMVGFVAGRNSG
jgi:hypothetical protein